jgi:hypothetical protein
MGHSGPVGWISTGEPIPVLACVLTRMPPPVQPHVTITAAHRVTSPLPTIPCPLTPRLYTMCQTVLQVWLCLSPPRTFNKIVLQDQWTFQHDASLCQMRNSHESPQEAALPTGPQDLPIPCTYGNFYTDRWQGTTAESADSTTTFSWLYLFLFLARSAFHKNHTKRWFPDVNEKRQCLETGSSPHQRHHKPIQMPGSPPYLVLETFIDKSRYRPWTHEFDSCKSIL